MPDLYPTGLIRASLSRFEDSSPDGRGFARALTEGWGNLPGLQFHANALSLHEPRWDQATPAWLRPLHLKFTDASETPHRLVVRIPWVCDPETTPPPDRSDVHLGAHRGVVDGRHRWPIIGAQRRPGIHIVCRPDHKPSVITYLIPEVSAGWSLQIVGRTQDSSWVRVRSDTRPLIADRQGGERQYGNAVDVPLALEDASARLLTHLNSGGGGPRIGELQLASDLQRLTMQPRLACGPRITESDLSALMPPMLTLHQTVTRRPAHPDVLGEDARLYSLLDPRMWDLCHFGDFLVTALYRGATAGQERLNQAVLAMPDMPAKNRVTLLTSHLQREVRLLGQGRGSYQSLVVTANPGNCVAAAELERQVTFFGPRGLPNLKGVMALRVLDEGWKSVLCPVHTPEGPKIGLVRHLAWGASQSTETTAGAARGEEDGSEDYAELSLAASLVPFVNHNDPTRVAIVSKMFGQALTVRGAEPPFVRTGTESAIAECFGVLRSPQVGRIQHDRPGLLSIHGGNTRDMPYGPADADSHGQDRSWVLAEPAGNTVLGGTLLAHAPEIQVDPVTEQPCLALGINARTALLTWYGWNYEDGIVVSESFVRRMTSRHTVRVAIDLGPDFAAPRSDADLRENPRLPASAWVRTGEIIAHVVKHGEQIDIVAAEAGELIPSPPDSPYRHLHLDGTEVSYRLRVTRPLAVGDKLTTRHGGKGVVNCVLPDTEMPYVETTDGPQPLEVLLNPTGVLRRLNIGTVLEMNTALLHRLQGDPGPVHAPRALGAEGREALATALAEYDAPGGRLRLHVHGRPVGPEEGSLVGELYILKLHHQAHAKAGARSDAGASPVTFQPAKSSPWTVAGRQGAPQRFGEMEIWGALAAGVPLLVMDLLHTRGVGTRALRTGTRIPAGLRAALAYLCVLGIAVEAELTEEGSVKHEIATLNLTHSPSVDPILIRSLRTVPDAAQAGLMDVWEKFGGRIEPGSPANEAEQLLELILSEFLQPAMRETVQYAVTLWRAVSNPLPGGERLLTRIPVLPAACFPPSRAPGERRSPEYTWYRELLTNNIELGRLLDKARSAQPDTADGAPTPWRLSSGQGPDQWDEFPPAYRHTLTRATHRLAGAVQSLLGSPEDEPAQGTIVGRLRGKYGLLRRNLLGSSAIRSARAVLSGVPNREIETVGLPRWILDALGVPPEPSGFEDVVVLNRQPTLHPYSLIAVRAQESPDETAGIHPYLLQALAGDFDGDTVAVHRPCSEAVREQAWRRLRPAATMRNAGSGQVQAKLDLDIAIGHGLAAAGPFGRRDLAKLLDCDGTALENPRTVRREVVGAVSAALPGDGDTEAAEAVLQRIGAAMTLGWDASQRWGFSLVDLPHLADPGATDTPGTVEKHLQTALDAPTATPMTRLAQAYVAGAGGKAVDLAQLLVTRGQTRSANPYLPSAQIDGCYLDGLATGEYFAAAQSGIAGLAAKKLVTPHAGALTRWLVNFAYETVIGEVDCGLTSSSRSPLTCLNEAPCQACYNDGTGQSPLPGTPVGILAGMFIGEQSTQLAMKAIHQRGNSNSLVAGITELGDLLKAHRFTVEADESGVGVEPQQARPLRTSVLALLDEAAKKARLGDPEVALAPALGAFERLLPAIDVVHAKVILRTWVDLYRRFHHETDLDPASFTGTVPKDFFAYASPHGFPAAVLSGEIPLLETGEHEGSGGMSRPLLMSLILGRQTCVGDNASTDPGVTEGGSVHV